MSMRLPLSSCLLQHCYPHAHSTLSPELRSHASVPARCQSQHLCRPATISHNCMWLQVYTIDSHSTASTILSDLDTALQTSHLQGNEILSNLRVVIFASAKHVFSALRDIAASPSGQRYPIALLPVGRSNDISRVSGWGNVVKGDWHADATVPDLLSAVTCAPKIKVDYWRMRVSAADKSSIKNLPRSFRSLGNKVHLFLTC